MTTNGDAASYARLIERELAALVRDEETKRDHLLAFADAVCDVADSQHIDRAALLRALYLSWFGPPCERRHE